MTLYTIQSLKQIEITDEYPYPEYIVRLESGPEKNTVIADWVFPGQATVQLLFYSPNSAELISVSPQLILPAEGDDGKFYSKSEIALFLTMVKNSVR